METKDLQMVLENMLHYILYISAQVKMYEMITSTEKGTRSSKLAKNLF